MSVVFEDGLHPVSHFSSEHGRRTALSQANRATEKTEQSAPQAYFANKSPESAPIPVGDDHNSSTCKEESRFVKAGMAVSKVIPDRILGVRKWTAIPIGAVTIAIIITLAAGMGVNLSRRDNDSTQQLPPESTASNTSADTSHSLATTSGSASASITATPGLTAIVAMVQCPKINNTIIVSSTSQFKVLCAVHWPPGRPAANNNGTVQNIGDEKLVAYSIQECLNHCVQYNNRLKRTVDPNENGSGCLAVTYNANLTNALPTHERNCFLKDRQGVYHSAQEVTESAVLIGT